MPDFYYDAPKLYTRMGLASERPNTPPDNQAMYWALDTRKLYAVNAFMQWYEINPDREGQYHVNVTSLTVTAFPSGILMAIPSYGAYIHEVRVEVEQAFDPGITATIGDNADVDRLMGVDDFNLQTIGTYQTNPLYSYSPGSFIFVYLSASSAFGIATCYISYDEAPTNFQQ